VYVSLGQHVLALQAIVCLYELLATQCHHIVMRTKIFNLFMLSLLLATIIQNPLLHSEILYTLNYPSTTTGHRDILKEIFRK
jgi:hypothetical protein